MNENLKDILSNLSINTDQETLLLYLQGKLSAEKQHELEKQMLNDDFEADAVEGLQDFKDPQHLTLLVDQLKRDLKKRTEKKNNYRDKLRLKNEPWLYITILIMLLLIIISYFIIYKHLHQ